ncbi:fluoride efflux transporter CrcB [Mesobacterium sp. TK19101]|uniref:Fluoride-specific ion channel FluC n=1 Tax=Mesobacterium hydrothermale TaxID=3111907 RepID=A0ABU6HG46_9RHOB|nr:fluoride efflux transporter CrcB [Mesobacterium sp. TK19101]MEC3861435.1 fluoride efflux transporter CrcB [Mesobacterium sp. TK19101]
MTSLTLLQVALGGAIGASCRFLTGHALLRLLGSGFPYGTFAVNVIGSFLMGVIVVLLGHFSANRFAPLLVTGFLGGFTTFSSFSLDVATLYERGQTGLAAVYVLSSVTLSIAALFAAMVLTRGALQ